jgi:hypothetical protein
MASRAIAVMVLVATCLSAPSALATSAGNNAKINRTRATLNRFFTAYEHRNVPGVLATLTSTAGYGDCDYLHHTLVDIGRSERNGQTLKRWLRARFAEHDQLHADVAHATIVAAPGRPVAGIPNRHTSDNLAPLIARGSIDFSLAFKFIMNGRGTRIEHTAMSSQSECPAGTLPIGAKPAQEQALAASFLAAYNQNDVTGVTKLLADDVSYHDCDYASQTPTTLQGRGAVATWLSARFADHDRFVQGQIVLDSWLSQYHYPPTTTVIRAVRQSTSLAALSASPHPTTLVLLPNASVDRIQSVEVWEPCS